jgi:hypothetical protein
MLSKFAINKIAREGRRGGERERVRKWTVLDIT